MGGSESRSDPHKHGIGFEEAQTVRADENSVEFFDPERRQTENRCTRIGGSTGTRPLLVIFCERKEGEVLRFSSARKATKREEKQYEKGI
jgi:uncharacterized DUF497 family protein